MSVSTSPIIIKRAKQAIADPSILERCSLGAKSEFRKLAYDGLCNPYKDEIKLLRHKLALARRAIGFSQEGLCNLVGLSREKVNQIENGKTALIVKDLYSICYRLKVNPLIFFISKNDLDYYNQKFKIDAHSLIKYWRNDFSIIKNALDSFKARELTVTFNKFRRYSQKLFEKHPGLMVNEWTAKVGAIIGLYVGKERKYFQVGAFFL